MLLLKRHLVELVRAGKKRQTVRLWSRALLKVGQISYTPGLGKMLITGVDRLGGLQELTEADAVADGFADLKGLLGEIRRIYGAGVPAGRSVFRIRFEWPVVGEAGRRVGESSSRQVVESSSRERGGPKGGGAGGGKKGAGHVRAAGAKRRGQRLMTARQREALRGFVVARQKGR